MPAPATSLLGCLKSYVQLIETRRSLQAEMDQALSSFLTARPIPVPLDGSDALSAPEVDHAAARGDELSACAAEAIRPPTEQELQQVLQIAFGGLVEVKEQAKLLVDALDERWDRKDLAAQVREIEQDESARIKAVSQTSLSSLCTRAGCTPEACTLGRAASWETSSVRTEERSPTDRHLYWPSHQTLERDQLRRLQTLQPELEFASSIQEKDATYVPLLTYSCTRPIRPRPSRDGKRG